MLVRYGANFSRFQQPGLEQCDGEFILCRWFVDEQLLLEQLNAEQLELVGHQQLVIEPNLELLIRQQFVIRQFLIRQ